MFYKKESCHAGFSACGGALRRHLHLSRCAVSVPLRLAQNKCSPGHFAPCAEHFCFIGTNFSMKHKARPRSKTQVPAFISLIQLFSVLQTSAAFNNIDQADDLIYRILIRIHDVDLGTAR